MRLLTIIFFIIVTVLCGAIAQTNRTKIRRRLYGLCPPGFTQIDVECYFISEAQVNWLDAHFECKDKNSKLAEPVKFADRQLRKYLISKDKERTDIWIGGTYDWKSNKWQWGHSGKEIKYQSFSQMDPRSSQNLQYHCAVLSPDVRYRWSARPCTDKYRYVCQHKMPKVSEKNRQKVYSRWNATYPNQMANEIVLEVTDTWVNGTRRRNYITFHVPYRVDLNVTVTTHRRMRPIITNEINIEHRRPVIRVNRRRRPGQGEPQSDSPQQSNTSMHKNDVNPLSTNDIRDSTAQIAPEDKNEYSNGSGGPSYPVGGGVRPDTSDMLARQRRPQRTRGNEINETTYKHDNRVKTEFDRRVEMQRRQELERKQRRRQQRRRMKQQAEREQREREEAERERQAQEAEQQKRDETQKTEQEQRWEDEQRRAVEEQQKREHDEQQRRQYEEQQRRDFEERERQRLEEERRRAQEERLRAQQFEEQSRTIEPDRDQNKPVTDVAENEVVDEVERRRILDERERRHREHRLQLQEERERADEYRRAQEDIPEDISTDRNKVYEDERERLERDRLRLLEHEKKREEEIKRREEILRQEEEERKRLEQEMKEREEAYKRALQEEEDRRKMEEQRRHEEEEERKQAKAEKRRQADLRRQELHRQRQEEAIRNSRITQEEDRKRRQQRLRERLQKLSPEQQKLFFELKEERRRKRLERESQNEVSIPE